MLMKFVLVIKGGKMFLFGHTLTHTYIFIYKKSFPFIYAFIYLFNNQALYLIILIFEGFFLIC